MDSKKGMHVDQSPTADHIKEIARPFEELEGAEELHAMRDFNDLVEDTLLQFAGDVWVHDDVWPDKTVNALLLKTPQDTEGSFMSICVELESLDNGTQERKISVQRMDRNGRGREYHEYYTDGDCVRRDDLGDIYDQMAYREVPKTGDPFDAVRFVLGGGMTGRSKDQSENTQLEQDVGLNRQPVGVEEVAALREVIESTELRYTGEGF